MITLPPGSTKPVPKFALFDLGFRPFFLGAGVFAVLSMAVWMAVYVFGWPLGTPVLSAVHWHAHEMIYGYGMAVIAGFLLTAVQNWTGLPTPHQGPLFALFSLWLVPRVLLLVEVPVGWAALFDLAFNLALVLAVGFPIIKAKRWKQLGVLAKVVLLGAGNALFYLGALGALAHGVGWGVYAGFYLIIALILTMGKRLVPFFIERGVGYSVQLGVVKAADVVGLGLFLPFFVFEVFLGNRTVAAFFAVLLFALHAWQWAGWHTQGIWKKPLLWGLYSAYGWVVVGFLLYALAGLGLISSLLAVHAFAVGGIGLMTLSMMARVTSGHGGRPVSCRSFIVFLSLLLVGSGAVVRVFLPLILPQFYLFWMLLAQTLWIVAFSLFLYVHWSTLFWKQISILG